VTLRLPGGDGRFLMKPAGIGLEEMTPDGIITVDREGERIDGTMPRHNEVFIHSEILRVRSDIAAVVHTHPPHAVAFSSLGRPLLPVGSSPRPPTSSSIRHAARRWHTALATARR